jgi:hypothetical protein
MADLLFSAKFRVVQTASYSIVWRWQQPKHLNKERRIPDRRKMNGSSSARSDRIADAGRFALGTGTEINSQTERAGWRLATEIVLNREQGFAGIPGPKRFSEAIRGQGMLS